MRVLVTGAGGLLGKEIWQLFGQGDGELKAIGRHQPGWVGSQDWTDCDITDATATYQIVTRINPDLIVHCAAFNDVDGCETKWKEAYRSNSLAVRNLALACQRFDATLMSVSSDYVFDGAEAPADGYREFDQTQPLSRYGESKWWGEVFVQQLLSKFYIVRTSWLFGPGRATWIDRIVELAQDGKPINAVTDMVSAPTYTPDLAAAMITLAKSQHYGIYHLTNQGFCDRVELAEEVLRLHKRAGYTGLRKLTQKELKLPAPRPAFSGLRNLAWELDGFKPLRPWKQAVAEHFSNSKVPS